MPLTKKGSKILSSMRAQYGGKKGEQVFYASINKGKIKGAEKSTKRAEGGPVGGRYPLPIVPIYDPVPGRESSSSLVPLKTTKGILPRRPYGENLPERARGGRAEPEKSESPGPPENFYRPSEQTWVYPEYKPLERLSEPIPMKSRYYRARGGRVSAYRAEGGDVKPLPIAREAVSIVPPSDPDVERLRHVLQGYKGLPSTYRSPWNQPMGKARGGHIDTQRLTAMMSHMRDRAVNKAAGGYIVGERGPEYFMPDHSGTIIPHHELDRLARKYGGRISNKRKR